MTKLEDKLKKEIEKLERELEQIKNKPSEAHNNRETKYDSAEIKRQDYLKELSDEIRGWGPESFKGVNKLTNLYNNNKVSDKEFSQVTDGTYFQSYTIKTEEDYQLKLQEERTKWKSEQRLKEDVKEIFKERDKWNRILDENKRESDRKMFEDINTNLNEIKKRNNEIEKWGEQYKFKIDPFKKL